MRHWVFTLKDFTWDKSDRYIRLRIQCSAEERVEENDIVYIRLWNPEKRDARLIGKTRVSSLSIDDDNKECLYDVSSTLQCPYEKSVKSDMVVLRVVLKKESYTDSPFLDHEILEKNCEFIFSDISPLSESSYKYIERQLRIEELARISARSKYDEFWKAYYKKYSITEKSILFWLLVEIPGFLIMAGAIIMDMPVRVGSMLVLAVIALTALLTAGILKLCGSKQKKELARKENMAKLVYMIRYQDEDFI